MNTVNINKKSWHYWLAKMYDGSIKYRDDLDICSYTRKVFAGFLILFAITFFVSFFAALLGYGLVGWFNVFVHGKWPVAGAGSPQIGMMIADCIVLGAAVLIIGIMYTAEQVENWNWKKIHDGPSFKTPAEPGALSKMWKHFKEKTCVKVEFKS